VEMTIIRMLCRDID